MAARSGGPFADRAEYYRPAMMFDSAVFETLLLAIESHAVPLPAEGPILVLNATPGDYLTRFPRDRLIVRTSLKPAHDALTAAGFDVMAPDSVELPAAGLTIVLPPRQREQARAVFARAVMAAPAGGYVLACLPNALGARSAEADLARLAGETMSLSKHKCRAFWTQASAGDINEPLASAWIAQDLPREIEPGLWSRPGLFSWDRIDAGSELLADCVPGHLAGVGLDLGAGNGFLAREVLVNCPRVERIDLAEADYRALVCQEATLAGHGGRFTLSWSDVLRDLPAGCYDFAVMNPPFHAGRADDNALGRAFIRAASRALKAGGTLWMVANRHLPYEEELAGAFRSHQIIENEDGYKVIRAERPRRST